MSGHAQTSAILAALVVGLGATVAPAQTASGLSGTAAPTNAPISGATAAPLPAPVQNGAGSGTARPAASATFRDLPSNSRLDESSKRIDRQIRRGICVGC